MIKQSVFQLLAVALSASMSLPETPVLPEVAAKKIKWFSETLPASSNMAVQLIDYEFDDLVLELHLPGSADPDTLFALHAKLNKLTGVKTLRSQEWQNGGIFGLSPRGDGFTSFRWSFNKDALSVDPARVRMIMAVIKPMIRMAEQAAIGQTTQQAVA